MKALFLNIILSLCALSVLAQVDRSEKPEPGPAKEIEMGEYDKFTLKNGLTVIVVENHKIPRIALSLIIDRDPLLEEDKVGYISMTGELIRRGTQTRTKERLDEEVDFIGATLNTSGSSVFASSLTKHREKLLELMTDVLFNPSFPEEELEKMKKQTLSGLKSNMDDPDYIAGNVKSVLMYGRDHPYGEIQLEEHVENISIADLKSYYETYFIPNISYMAIVGDITPKEAKKLAEKYFGKWEKGEIPEVEYKLPKLPSQNVMAIVNRPASVQTVLSISYPIELMPGSENVIKASVMNQIFGGSSASRLFKNIREDKGYTYGAYSRLSSDELIGDFNAGASVRSEVTDSAVTEFLYEMKQIRNETVPDTELQLAKNVLIGSFGRSLERPQTVAAYAINIERYNLPEDYYNNYVKNVQAVSAEDIQEMAKKYISPENAYIVAVGKAREIENELAAFGQVKYYDIYGNEIDPSLVALPDGLTAEKVIDDYLAAIGGKEKLESVESVKMVMSAEAMGNGLKMTKVNQVPEKLNIRVEMAGNLISEQIYDGENAKVLQMGNPIPVTEDMKAQLALEASPFPVLNYAKMGVTTKLTGMEQVDGKDTYIVEVTNPGGKTYSLNFDSNSKLIVRKTETAQMPNGQTIVQSTDFGDYQSVEGIMFPHTVKIPLGPGFKAEAKMDSIEVNGEIPEELFSTD